jgi:hypothetical protein
MTHWSEPDPAEQARWFGPETPVLEWRKRLACSRYGSRNVDVVMTTPDTVPDDIATLRALVLTSLNGPGSSQGSVSLDHELVTLTPVCYEPEPGAEQPFA